MSDDTETDTGMPYRIQAMVLARSMQVERDVLDGAEQTLVRFEPECARRLEEPVSLSLYDMSQYLCLKYEGELNADEMDCIEAVLAWWMVSRAGVYMNEAFTAAVNLDDTELTERIEEVQRAMGRLQKHIKKRHPLSRYGVES